MITENYNDDLPSPPITLGVWTKMLIEHYEKPWYIRLTKKWKYKRDYLVNMATNYSVGG